MITREDKIQHAKEAIKYMIPLIMAAAPWLDFSQLHIGRDSSLLYSDSFTEVFLFFQAATDETGSYLSETTFWRAEHFKDCDIVNQQLTSAKLDPQIKHIHCSIWSSNDLARWSEFTKVPGWKPISGIGYYTVTLTILYNNFKPGDIVKIKPQWLDPGEAAGIEYEVIEEQHDNHVKVKLRQPDPKRAIQGSWDWPAHTLYLA